MNKGKAIGIVVIVLIIAGAIYYRNKVVQTGLIKTSSVISTNSSVPGWKNYDNEKYGFGFAYPSGWVIKENELRDIRLLFSLEFTEEGVSRMTVDLLPREETSYGGITAFKNGYEKFNYFHGGTIEDTSIDGFRTLVDFNGCYECYGVENIDQISSQVTSLTCNTTDVCLQITLYSTKDPGVVLKDFYIN